MKARPPLFIAGRCADLGAGLCAALCFALSLVGCATGNSLNDFPVQAIERGLTLPEGVSAWKPFLGSAADGEPNSFIYPLFWEQGYTKRLTVIWMPLPLHARYELLGEDRTYLSIEVATLGYAYSRDKNFDWRPLAELKFKHRLNDTVALRYSLQGQLEISRAREDNVAKTLAVQAGVELQINDWLNLFPSIWVLNESGIALARYSGRVPSENLGSDPGANRIRYPLGLDITARLSRRLEMGADIDLFQIGYPGDYVGLPIFLTLAYYW